MRVLDLFSGIGGFSLGLERAGMTTVGFCEIDPFCREVLRAHWPEVWIHDDVRTLTTPLIRERCGHIDLIAGGFPCQDLSAAGKGAGLDGERSGLWWELCGIIARLRPAWLLIENVPALRTRGADRVLSCLEGIGYSVRPLVVGAWAVGAPHKRDRVWIVARLADADIGGRGQHKSRRGEEERIAVGRAGEAVADAQGCGQPSWAGLWQDGESRRGRQLERGSQQLADSMREGREVARHTGAVFKSANGVISRPAIDGDSHAWPARPGEQQYEWEAPRLLELPLGGELDGVPVRLVRRANKHALKAYGNAVVPQVVEAIGRAILAANMEATR